MKLKCIGGECDGEIIDVSNNLKIHDFVRVQKKPKSSTLNYNIDKDAKVNYYIYKISCFHFSKDDVYMFLVSEGWTNKQAVIYQFSK